MSISSVLLSSLTSASNIYLTDDFCLDISSIFGSAVMSDPTSTVEINIVFGGVFVLPSWITLTDLALGSDFTNGKVVAVIDSSVLDLQVRQSGYKLAVRITNSNGIQSTYITFNTINLLTV